VLDPAAFGTRLAFPSLVHLNDQLNRVGFKRAIGAAWGWTIMEEAVVIAVAARCYLQRVWCESLQQTNDRVPFVLGSLEIDRCYVTIESSC
jgi:hypothetical protein